MNFFMINFKKFNFLMFVILILSLNSCADLKQSREAYNKSCKAPSANYAFLEIRGIQPTGTTKDLRGYYKYFSYIFKEPILKVDDRCKHTNTLLKALYDNEDHKVYRWINSNNKTSGKIIITLSREYGTKICRDYYSYINVPDKRYVYQGTACIGNQLADPTITVIDYWNFYPYQSNQMSGRPILESWGTLNDVEHIDKKRSNYKFHCSKNPSRCG